MEGFRTFQNAEIELGPGITVLVGENNVGKSTVGLAIQKLFGGGLGLEDARDRVPSPILLEAELGPREEVIALLQQYLSLDKGASRNKDILDKWLLDEGAKAVLSLKCDSSLRSSLSFRFGDLGFESNLFFLQKRVGQKRGGAPVQQWSSFISVGDLPTGHALENLLGQRAWQLEANVPEQIAAAVQYRFKRFEEFRLKAAPAQGAANVESLSGLESANVLFNLRNHANPEESVRYDMVIQAFEALFPHYKIVVVETSPGSGVPDIQFRREGRPPQTLSQVSSGTNQMLTLLTNLLGRRGLILFIEHPEALLHPQSMRFLQRLLIEASEPNQIIITTHDPHFVSAGNALGLRRIWTLRDDTKVSGLSNELSVKELGQIETALRNPGAKEVVFARAVILVEDESQCEFLLQIAPTLGRDIDAHGISVIPVGGEHGYKPYRTLLDALNIPYVCLRDKRWGQDIDFPPARFFALGAEIEEYLDSQGLAELRLTTKQDVGQGKPRVMAALGAQLKKEDVPKLFDDLLQAAIAASQP